MKHIFKFFIRCLLRLLYRVEVSGLENYDQSNKRLLIIANHTSLLDGLLLYAWLPKTPFFAIDTGMTAKKVFRPFLQFVSLFEMDTNNPVSIKSVIKFIKADHSIVIFPEGRITVTGMQMKIYEGTGLIADKTGASILPVSIEGAQFSPFSYMKKKGFTRWFPKIRMTMLAPKKLLIPKEIKGQERRKQANLKIQDLMHKLAYTSVKQDTTLYSSLIEASHCFGKNHQVLEDVKREKLRYKDLILRSILLSQIIKRQTAEDEHVGIIMPNINALAIVFFALQFICRIPTMLNFSAGALAVRRACETTQVKIIYSSRVFIENANFTDMVEELSHDYTIVYLEDLKTEISFRMKLHAFLMSINPARHYAKQCANRDPDKAALVLLTSGSEGHPKGVVLTHRNLLSNYAQVNCHIYFNPEELVFTCLPLFHSFGINAGFLMPLFGGAKTFLYPTPLHYRIIPELIYQLGATIFFGTNTFLKNYVRFAHPYDFYSLKTVVAGAEKLHHDTASLWAEKYGIRIMQGYGVTETSPVISVNNLMSNKTNTVGRPIPELEYYLKPIEGIEKGGSLVVKGPNVMQGYLFHDQLGKVHPPATEKGLGWYDTGDIAELDDEGFITIKGRVKRFAKVAGEMVSLSAVEELATLTWPEKNHAAIAIADKRKGEKIILVTEYDEANRRHIQKTAKENHISELLIPREIIMIDKIPVLGSGKTDYPTLLKTVNPEQY